MQRILYHNRSQEMRYVARRMAPIHQTFSPKMHLKTTLENIGDDLDMPPLIIKVPKVFLQDSGMMTDDVEYSGKRFYKAKLDELQLDYDINESLLEEQSIELESLREELFQTHRKLDSESAQRMNLENEIEVLRAAASQPPAPPEPLVTKEELDNLRREVHYYHCRMEQEKQLSRQLLTQIEAMKANRVPLETEGESDVVVEVNVEPAGESILSRACIVCSERHAYYEPMPCDHPMCTECYVHWYASRMQYNDTRREGEPPVVFGCPLCRTPISI